MNFDIDNIIIFTDGSCIGNGGINAKAGIGIYYPNNEFPNISEPFKQFPITNQRAELHAIYTALSHVTKYRCNKITLYSDSLYSIKCVTEWIKKWKNNNWKTTGNKPVKNLDIIQKIDKIIEAHPNKIIFKHVRSHTKKQDFESICNSKADQLACLGTQNNE